jgi:hypothetical protein
MYPGGALEVFILGKIAGATLVRPIDKSKLARFAVLFSHSLGLGRRLAPCCASKPVRSAGASEADACQRWVQALVCRPPHRLLVSEPPQSEQRENHREPMEQQRRVRGAGFVPTPDEMIEKILFQHERYSHQRFLMYLGNRINVVF